MGVARERERERERERVREREERERKQKLSSDLLRSTCEQFFSNQSIAFLLSIRHFFLLLVASAMPFPGIEKYWLQIFWEVSFRPFFLISSAFARLVYSAAEDKKVFCFVFRYDTKKKFFSVSLSFFSS
jgi:hypothetical protein